MKIQKAHVVCLYPTKEQESFLFNIGGVTRFLYNIALYQRNIWGKNVRQKAGLNRSILDQGWGLFRQMCGYKSKFLGGQCIDVSPRNTSREFRVCGHTSADNRTSQSKFRCVHIGHTENADDNACVVILKRAVDNGLLPVEAMRQHAIEAGSLSLKGEACHMLCDFFLAHQI